MSLRPFCLQAWGPAQGEVSQSFLTDAETCPTALLNFAAFEAETWATNRTAVERGRHRHRLSRGAEGCGACVRYLQLGKELLEQHVKAAVFNVAKGAEDIGFVVILFCHVFICVVSARKYHQGQNNLCSKES